MSCRLLVGCRGAAFIDYIDPGDASKLLTAARNAGGLWIDGAAASVTLARDTQAMAPKSTGSGAMSSVAAQALAAAAWGINQAAAPPKPAASRAAASQPQQAASSYVFDPSSGLYYDAATSYFFDPKTSVYLYYNQDQKKYMCYDEESKGYILYNPAKPPKACPPPAGVELTASAQPGDGARGGKT